MKREILFRAFDKKQNYMAYQGSNDLETLESFVFHFGRYDLMQSTGCKDINKRSIFEGDFVKCTNPESMFFDNNTDHISDYYLVKWDSEKQGWNAFPISTLDKAQFDEVINQLGGLITWPNSNVLNNSWHYEVIGNIHENPELLGSETAA